KRCGLTKISSCVTLLNKHAIERQKHIESIYNSGNRNYEKAKEVWENKNGGKFPDFRWNKENPGAGVPDLTGLWNSNEEIINWLNSFNEENFNENAYWDLTAPI